MRTILGMTAIAAGFFWYIGKNKADEYLQAFKQLEFKPLGIKNLRISGGKLSFYTNLKIKNNSLTDLDLDTAKKVVLSRIFVYNANGEYLGKATPNLSSINLPAQSTTVVENINTVVPLDDLGSVLTNALSIIQNPNSLKLKLEFSAFGETFTVEA